MLLLVMYTSLFLICSAQEHLTCLRTEDVLTLASPSTPRAPHQGVPGKRGPVGLKGEAGSDGIKGEKGDKGVPDSSQIEALQGEINSLRRLVEALNSSLNDVNQIIHDQYFGWFTFNGYRYKATPNTQSWHQSRRVCQSWRADLAVYGGQTMESRRNIIDALQLTDRFWIGASDEENEGIWKWVNGDIATSEQLIWDRGQPDNAGNNEDCGEIVISLPSNRGSNDRPCSNALIGLCESTV